MELLEQIENHVRLPALNLVAHRLELVPEPQRPHVVARLAQRGDHVILVLPLMDFLLAMAFERIRRHHLRMKEHQNPQTPHTASQRRDGLCSESIVLAVNKTLKCSTSSRLEPTARNCSSRHRPIISSNTASRVS